MIQLSRGLISLAVMLSWLAPSAQAQDPNADLTALQNSCLSRLDVVPVEIDTSVLSAVPNIAFNQCLAATLESTGSAIGGALLDNSSSSRLRDAFSQGAGLGTGLNLNQCTLTEPVKDIKCEVLNKDGDQRLQQLLTQNDMAVAGFQCQQDALKAMDSKLKCIQGQAEQIKAVADRVGEVFAGIDRQVKGQITQYDQDKQNCESQGTDLNNKAQEIDAVAKVALDLVDQSAGSINNSEAQLRAAEQAEKSLPQIVKLQTAAYANKCMQEESPDYQCQVNDPSSRKKVLESRDVIGYAACLLPLNAVTGKTADGKKFIDGSKKDSKLAKARQDGDALKKAARTGLFGEMPTDGDIPTQPDAQGQGGKGATKSFEILSESDFDASAFAKSLKKTKFSRNGFSAYDLVRSRVTECFKEARKRVKRELDADNGDRSATSALGAFRQQVNETRQAAFAAADTLVNQFDQAFQTIKTALKDVNTPFTNLEDIGIPGGDVDRCNKDYASRKICLRAFEKGLKDVVKGTAPHSQVNIEIKGSVRNTFVNCFGLRGCSQALRTKARKITSDLQRNEAMRNLFKNDSNSKITQFGKNIATAIGQGQSQLKQYLDQVNSILTATIKTKPISFPSIKGEALKDSDNDGIMDPPQDALKFLGGQTALLKIDGESIGPALEGLEKKQEDIDKKKGEAEKAKMDLLSKAAECAAKTKEHKGAESKLTAIEKECSALESYPDEASNAIDALTDAIGEALGAGLGSGEEVSSLSTGAQSQTAAELVRLRAELRSKERELQGLGTPNPQPSPGGGLTAQELERNRLLAQISSLEADISSKQELIERRCISVSQNYQAKVDAIQEAITRKSNIDAAINAQFGDSDSEEAE